MCWAAILDSEVGVVVGLTWGGIPVKSYYWNSEYKSNAYGTLHKPSAKQA